jgi:hypothetical protein
MGDGALILLLAEDAALAAEEELLAELGYEPLGFALSTPHAVLREAALACDAIVISSPHIRVVEALLHDLADALQGRRLLVAAPDHVRPSGDPARLSSAPGPAFQSLVRERHRRRYARSRACRRPALMARPHNWPIRKSWNR